MTPRSASIVIALLALVATASAAAQPASRTYRVGMLWSSGDADASSGPRLQAFERTLAAEGFVIGRNLEIDHRYAKGQLDRFPALAGELVAAKVDVIVAASPLSIRAARRATATIPIVMINGDRDMVGSLARPGGNITGLIALQEELAAKQVELIREAVPGLTRVGLLRNPTQPVHALKFRAADAMAQRLGLEVRVAEARAPEDFAPAFALFARERVGGVVVFADGTYLTNRATLAELGLRHALPTCFGSPGAAHAGGLIAYVPSFGEAYRRAAGFVAKILRGAQPGELPVEQPTLFELSVNLKTARTLGLTLPQPLLARADDVIQ